MIRLHCFTQTGFHAHGGYAIVRESEEAAVTEAIHHSGENGLVVYLADGTNPVRVFRNGKEIGDDVPNVQAETREEKTL